MLTLLYPTISRRELLCLPKSGPAVTGAGDFADICSGAGSRMPLLAKDGYADLFCLTEASRADVSTRSEPVGGRVNWNELLSTGVARPFGSWFRFPEIRAKSDTLASLGSLFVLSERSRPSECCCVVFSIAGVPPGPVPPDVGNSVWIKQHRFP